MKGLITFLLIIFGLISVWDTFTTFYGTYILFDGANYRILISIIVAVMLMAFLLSTFYIYDQTYSDDFFGIIFRSLWLIALAFDLFTSYMGNSEFILNGNTKGTQLVGLIAMTLLVSGSPILFSYLWDKQNNY